jgi:hypothetical protein
MLRMLNPFLPTFVCIFRGLLSYRSVSTYLLTGQKIGFKGLYVGK